MVSINYTSSYNSLLFVILICCSTFLISSFGQVKSANGQQVAPGTRILVKQAAFTDPNTNYLYRVVSYNQTTYNSNVKSIITVSRIKLNQQGKFEDLNARPENVQTINFQPALVDFDLHCQKTHCYMIALTSKSKRNVELYSWQRTQFDLLAKKDSFARGYSIKLFKIKSQFYIAIAQEQLHLNSRKSLLINPNNDNDFDGDDDDEAEPIKFIGCAVLKFNKTTEHNLRYHQFIKLPFNPRYVNQYVSTTTQALANSTGQQFLKPQENHYLVFSQQSQWNEPGSNQVYSFIWSPLNDLFWPYKLPDRIAIDSRPNQPDPIITFPGLNERPPNRTDQLNLLPVESCFSQLQRLLADRELYARKLIDSSRSLWRSSSVVSEKELTSISAQVIVHGNVYVRGSLVESPQITLIGPQPLPSNINDTRRYDSQILNLVNAHSPLLVENKLKQAFYKLDYIRDKLAKAVTIGSALNQRGFQEFNSRINFYSYLSGDKITFQELGIANSNVKLNGIPFKQLEHELVGLRGAQEVAARVIFEGNVVADLLEIRGKINGEYFLKDAIDIRSNQMQVVTTSTPYVEAPNAYDFASISVKEIALSHNATINDIRLNDFITRDNRTQYVHGSKIFKHLSLDQLDVANSNVLLNGHNVTNIALKAIHLRQPNQVMFGEHVSFAKPIKVGRLFINNLINGNINFTSLIFDSVKSNVASLQQITGHKYFHETLKINQLLTDGLINNLPVKEVFNLNPSPPVPDYQRYVSGGHLGGANLITGNFLFNSTLTVTGNMNARLINGVDISKRAIRRFANHSALLQPPIQFVSGRKTFYRPLRILNQVKLLNSTRGLPSSYPLINGFDLKSIIAGIDRQVRNPPLINIDNLEIDGNLNLRTDLKENQRSTIGNYQDCPLHLIHSKLVLGGNVRQIIDSPVRIETLRARSIKLDSNSLNGFNFPNDFVLRSSIHERDPFGLATETKIEPIFGRKHFNHLVIVPWPNQYHDQSRLNKPYYQQAAAGHNKILLGSRSSINDIRFEELQAFLSQERQKNSSGGETVLKTMNVFGNVYVKRINGQSWPEDILLKSISSNYRPSPSNYLHKRIYSPLIFSESSPLEVLNQLVLRGPVQLRGKLNGVNLTEFARNSATYGDKDLLSIGRPIQNKIFLGGLTVTGQISSQGLIDGVNFEQLRNRVVTIDNSGRNSHIISPKMFMSDVLFSGPLSMVYLNDLPLNQYLNQINVQPTGENSIRIFGKKTVSGSLVINRNLFVQGMINGNDFAELQARAIPLNSITGDELVFNKTLTIEGDVFMDNLIIDERDGVIDGVKLSNMLPFGAPLEINGKKPYDGRGELVIMEPTLTGHNISQGHSMNLAGSINDCQISCSLNQFPHPSHPASTIPYSPPNNAQQPIAGPLGQSAMGEFSPYPPRAVQYQGRNVTFMRTTPPYAQQQTSPPPWFKRQTRQAQQAQHIPAAAAIYNLASRRPAAIQYEYFQPGAQLLPPLYSNPMEETLVIKEQIELLRQQMVSPNLLPLISSSPSASDLVIGFVDSISRDLGSLILPDQLPPHSGHYIGLPQFLQLDQIDFPFAAATYHLAVGVSTASDGRNVTSVYSSVGGSDVNQVSQLPVESPNSAMFLKIQPQFVLWLLVSQDYTIKTNGQYQCPRYLLHQRKGSFNNNYQYLEEPQNGINLGGVHVYLFHALKNSSSPLASAYFDLYQTIDLPNIDGFESFEYKESYYALAISRATETIHVLLLRGYSGFQMVSSISAPNVENVKILYTEQLKPMLMIFTRDGHNRLMESVII